MIGISTRAPMAHADPTSSPGAPSSSRWMEKYQLIAIDADQTRSTAGRKRATGRWRSTTPIPLSRGKRGAAPVPAQGQDRPARPTSDRRRTRRRGWRAGALDQRSGEATTTMNDAEPQARRRPYRSGRCRPSPAPARRGSGAMPANAIAMTATRAMAMATTPPTRTSDTAPPHGDQRTDRDDERRARVAVGDRSPDRRRHEPGGGPESGHQPNRREVEPGVLVEDAEVRVPGADRGERGDVAEARGGTRARRHGPRSYGPRGQVPSDMPMTSLPRARPSSR